MVLIAIQLLSIAIATIRCILRSWANKTRLKSSPSGLKCLNLKTLPVKQGSLRNTHAHMIPFKLAVP